MKHINIKIYGRVQQVGYRFTSMEVAYKYGVEGFVQYVDDGSLYIEVEGEDENVEKFIK